jgi:hypothetical protein
VSKGWRLLQIAKRVLPSALAELIASCQLLAATC